MNLVFFLLSLLLSLLMLLICTGRLKIWARMVLSVPKGPGRSSKFTYRLCHLTLAREETGIHADLLVRSFFFYSLEKIIWLFRRLIVHVDRCLRPLLCDGTAGGYSVSSQRCELEASTLAILPRWYHRPAMMVVAILRRLSWVYKGILYACMPILRSKTIQISFRQQILRGSRLYRDEVQGLVLVKWGLYFGNRCQRTQLVIMCAWPPLRRH